MRCFTRRTLCAVVLALNVQGAWAESDANAGLQLESANARPSANALSDGQVADSGTRYESAFEGYRPYQEDEVRSWQSVNDEVGRIGGWQAYAREAMQGNAVDAAPRSAGDAAQADPHAAHQMK